MRHMQLRIITIDFETHYSDEYSLRRMTPPEYILDPRFEVIGAAIRIDTVSLPMPAPPEPPHTIEFDRKAAWLDGPNLKYFFASEDVSRCAIMSHNIGFDGAILAWRFGIVPRLYIDTLGMCRALIPEAKGASLEKALAHIGAPPKGTALAQAKGLRLVDLHRDPRYYREYTDYAKRDCDGCFWLFRYLAHGFSGIGGVGRVHRNEEFLLMDMIARMTVQPQFMLDSGVLRAHLTRIESMKDRLLATLKDQAILDPDNPKGDLMSNDRYAEVLRRAGVEPPRKISFRTGKETWAFSKDDREFMDLLEDDDPVVQALVAARLGFKSTLEETRTKRFIALAGLRWPLESRNGAPLPFPLKYSGAHTHRYSGEWSLNLQNLGRESDLRRALIAPAGHKIVSADAAQIEARTVAWLAGCAPLVQAFARNEDVYSSFASRVYGFPVNKADHPTERFLGKTAVLGLGYAMGVPKFIATCWKQSKRKVHLDFDFGQRVVRTYRDTYWQIPDYWRSQEQVCHLLASRTDGRLGPLIVDGKDQSVILPNGMRLFYREMRKEFLPVPGNPDAKREQWVFQYGRETKYTFGGKMTENAVQALAKIITMNAATRIRRKAKMGSWVPHLAGQIHDQLVYVVPESIAQDFLALVIEEMRARLDWWHDLPLDAEGGIGDNLLEVK
jgi:DNA polymerase